MNEEKIKYLGEYRFRSGARHSETHWASRISFLEQGRRVVDSAGRIDGQDVIRLIPYGETNHVLDGILHDGDLLAYIEGAFDIKLPSDLKGLENKDMSVIKKVGGWLKGRATHAELGYIAHDGHSKQVSVWGDADVVSPFDRPFHIRACGDTINIYRISLREYGVDAQREKALKAEIKRWKEIVRPIIFPRGDLEMCIDLADFTTVLELKKIANELISHASGSSNPPLPFKLNCVQWSTLVFSLAICFPLSKRQLDLMGAMASYEKNWAARLGYADDGLEGLDELPIPFYTINEIIENTLNQYWPERRTEISMMLSRIPIAELLSREGVPDGLRVMPNAFVVENRLRSLGFPRKNRTVFEYVGTAAPESELVRGQEQS